MALLVWYRLIWKSHCDNKSEFFRFCSKLHKAFGAVLYSSNGASKSTNFRLERLKTKASSNALIKIARARQGQKRWNVVSSSSLCGSSCNNRDTLLGSRICHIACTGWKERFCPQRGSTVSFEVKGRSSRRLRWYDFKCIVILFVPPYIYYWPFVRLHHSGSTCS